MTASKPTTEFIVPLLEGTIMRIVTLLGIALLTCACGATETLSNVTCDDPGLAGSLECAVCGNGIVEAGEACDSNGNESQSCAYGQKDCMLCNESCELNKVDGSYCGDNILDSEFGETCDDGNSQLETCAYGELSCHVCAPGCTLTPGVTSLCGDGIINGAETCDDGNTIMELCEYGEENCSVCDNACEWVDGQTSLCGDGILDESFEDCDDGNESDDDACLSSCVVATCGDGYVQAGIEACDDGNEINQDGCLTSCTPASCGDGFVRPGFETCDDGNLDNTDTCLDTCAVAGCGDGFVQLDVESCDDANQEDTDSCLSSCELASCGDGFVQLGVEACDDGNSDELDGCSSSCSNGFCGDDIVQPESEECDDGNDDDLDGCTNDCMGDLVINGSFEEPALQMNSWSGFDSILGWERSFGPKIEIQNNVAGSAHHGDQLCELDSNSATGIYQDLVTVVGQTYVFGFHFSARPGVALISNRMEALWGGEVVVTVEANGSGQSLTQWQIYEYEVTATASLTRIEFRDVGQSDSMGSYLDAVSVRRVLE